LATRDGTAFKEDEGLENIRSCLRGWVLCSVIRTILSGSKRAIGRKGQNHCPHLSASSVSRNSGPSCPVFGISRDYHIFVGDLVP